MNKSCLVCLNECDSPNGYHRDCLKTLFGSATVPQIELEEGLIQTAALAMAGRTSLSGVQKKLSVKLSADFRTLQIAAEGGSYILKPRTGTFSRLPEIEHTTMQLARLAKLEVADNGLIRAMDGQMAYLAKRFDRRTDGSKIHQEDFCQLAGISPAEKYAGSAELCVRIVRQFATEPGIEMVKLFRQFLFSWWVGNGDLHLKNLSLLIDSAGVVKLTPAYDLVATRLLIPDDELAMPICGRDRKLTRNTWLKFADYAAIQRRAALRIISDQVKQLSNSIELLQHSYLSESEQVRLSQLLQERTAVLNE